MSGLRCAWNAARVLSVAVAIGCGGCAASPVEAPAAAEVAANDEVPEAEAAPAASDDQPDPGAAFAALLQMGEPATPVGLLARIHFNTQTRDFDASRAFYRALGFTSGVSGFPLTNTHEMARALGMFDLCSYELIAGEVMALDDAWSPANIDLLQWKTPYNDEPPYELPNHLGMAYAGLLTTDLVHDVEVLAKAGAEFLSEPFGVPGNRFVFFRDPDGVLYKLEEKTPPHRDQERAIYVRAMPYIAINVSDLEQSLDFYRTLGYTEVRRFAESADAGEGAAYGLSDGFERRGADVTIPNGDRHRLRLVQWVRPYDDAPPYPAPISHIGIQRLALLVANLDAAVAHLKDLEVPFLSEIAPCCSGTGTDEAGIVHAIDPDGVFVELVGAIAPREPVPPPEWCRDGTGG